MSVSLAELRPYKSFTLCKLQEESEGNQDVVPGIIESLKKEAEKLETTEKVFDGESFTYSQDLEGEFFYYIKNTRSPWTLHNKIIDTAYHVVVVCKRKHLLALHFSDNAFQNKICRRIEDASQGSPGVPGSLIEKLRFIDPGILANALDKGESKKLWLTGVHRRTHTKVDNKIISGIDLQYALDPLGDQTYYFTSARAQVNGMNLKQNIGITPRHSGIWIGTTQDWEDFKKTVLWILEQVEVWERNSINPMVVPILATPVTGNVPQVGEAFDAALVSTQMVDPDADQEIREITDRWSRLDFNITDTDGVDFKASLTNLDQFGTQMDLGELWFRFDLGDLSKIKFRIERVGMTHTDLEIIETMLTLLPHLLKVWYDSGHTLADQRLIYINYRDFPFDNFKWANMTGIDIKKEKPSPLDADTIGTQDSLFCWVKKNWPQFLDNNRTGGWLACDDGAMEIADFIHVDADNNVMSLIHVKASKRDNPDRRISVSEYEVVVGQAVKNLRFLDWLLMSERLEDGMEKQIGKAVWHNGLLSTRENMINVIREMGTNFKRRVVIIQPRLQKQRFIVAQKSTGSNSEYERLKQLYTLLNGARANCQALGAEFFVIGENW